MCIAALVAGAPGVAASDETTQALDRVVARNADEHGIPAQAIVVLRNGEPVYRGFSGRTTLEAGAAVDARTVFPAMSVSKLFAAALLLQLVEQGHVGLAAPASRYVDGMPAAWHTIPVGHFLDHVSGVPEYFDVADLSQPFPASLRDVFARLADTPLVEPSGTRTRYTQTNYLVVAAILEAVTGERYPALVRSRILAPLGLRDTWLGVDGVPPARRVGDYHGKDGRLVPDVAIDWPPYAAAHTGVYSTADDLARFLAAVADGRFASREALLRFWKPHVFANGNTGYFASGWDYGESGEWREVGHDGGAKLRVRVLFRDSLDSHFVIVYLTNGSRDNVWSRTLVDSVQAIRGRTLSRPLVRHEARVGQRLGDVCAGSSAPGAALNWNLGLPSRTARRYRAAPLRPCLRMLLDTPPRASSSARVKRALSTIALLASCFAARSDAACNDGESVIPPRVVPTLAAHAATRADLVPSGWKQVDAVHDDYDRDGREDVALVIAHADPANLVENCGVLGADEFDTSPHVLLVALQRPDGGYAPFAQDGLMIPRRVDAVRDPPYGGLATAKGVVSVKIGFWQSAGSWYTSTHEYKFRAEGNCMRLIGSEYLSIHRGSMDEERVSTNYLTGRSLRSETLGDSGETTQAWQEIEGDTRHCLGDADAVWVEAE